MSQAEMRAPLSDSSVALNPEQCAAVEHGEGPLLVVAGAGTGKTRVITERIRRLLETNPQLPGEAILGLTFTDKAAGEMKHRVVQAVGERGREVWLSTFHSFCLEKILLPLEPDLKAADDVDHWILLRRNLSALELRHFKRLAEPGEFLSDFVRFFSRCQDELVTPEDYERYLRNRRAAYETARSWLDLEQRKQQEEELDQIEEVARVYRISERLLRERNLVTFGAQLLRSVLLLQANSDLLARLRAQYRYLLVDEFQDTNIAQLELLWLLAGGHRNIFAVGDDDQAIYRFRGASFGSFTIFLRRFCDLEGNPGTRPKTLLSLVRNYRSTPRILRVAEQVIAQNEKSPLLPPKKLIPARAEGERIRIVEFPSREAEANWIAGELERIHGLGHRWRSCAVLYRKHIHRDRLVEVLRRRQIPFVIRKLSILSSTVVRDLIAYLRLIDSAADNVSCARVLGIPYWRCEARDLVRLAERAGRNRGTSLWGALESAQQEFAFRTDGPRTSELVGFISGFRERAKHLAVSELLEELIAGLAIAPLPSDADAAYLRRFSTFAREWEKHSETWSLREFIQHLDYFAEAGGEICLDEDPTEDAVQLMTAHSAKGLEFDHVFLIELGRNDFPARPQPVMFEFPPELMKEEKPKGDFHIQEERRLFYVALTRARRHLTLTAVVNRRKRPSPFLEDILSNSRITKQDTQQLSPEVALPAGEEVAAALPANAARPSLFALPERDARAYSQIALWAKAFHPPPSEPLKLSASAIDTYQSCPMKYLFQQLWSLRGGPQAALTFGSVMHTTIREFIGELRKRRVIPLQDVLATYDREWSSAGYRDPYQEQEYRKAGREQLEAFHRTTTASPPDVIGQEKAFELALEPNVIVLGRIDQINRLGKSEVEVVDYKTGTPRQPQHAQKSLQLSLYAIAAREVFELSPARLVFYNLATNEAVGSTRDKKALGKAKETVAEVADQIRAGEFPAKPGYLCRYCDFRPICPAHEQLLSLSTTPTS